MGDDDGFLRDAGVAFLLIALRDGDAIIRLVWRCARNDECNNIITMLATFGIAWADASRIDVTVATGRAVHEHLSGKRNQLHNHQRSNGHTGRHDDCRISRICLAKGFGSSIWVCPP